MDRLKVSPLNPDRRQFYPHSDTPPSVSPRSGSSEDSASSPNPRIIARALRHLLSKDNSFLRRIAAEFGDSAPSFRHRSRTGKASQIAHFDSEPHKLEEEKAAPNLVRPKTDEEIIQEQRESEERRQKEKEEEHDKFVSSPKEITDALFTLVRLTKELNRCEIENKKLKDALKKARKEVSLLEARLERALQRSDSEDNSYGSFAGPSRKSIANTLPDNAPAILAVFAGLPPPQVVTANVFSTSTSAEEEKIVSSTTTTATQTDEQAATVSAKSSKDGTLPPHPRRAAPILQQADKSGNDSKPNVVGNDALQSRLR